MPWLVLVLNLGRELRVAPPAPPPVAPPVALVDPRAQVVAAAAAPAVVPPVPQAAATEAPVAAAAPVKHRSLEELHAICCERMEQKKADKAKSRL